MRFKVTLLFKNGQMLTTEHEMELGENYEPNVGFFLGFLTRTGTGAVSRSGAWVKVGDIGYIPDDVSAVQFTAIDEAP